MITQGSHQELRFGAIGKGGKEQLGWQSAGALDNSSGGLGTLDFK